MSTQEPKEESIRPLCPLLMVAGSIAWQLKPAPAVVGTGGGVDLTVLERSPSTVCIEGACAWWFQPRPIVVWNPEAELSEPKEGRGRCGVAR